MYLTHVKTLFRDAMSKTFDGAYPVPDFRDLLVSMEYPTKEGEIPSIWLDFEPIGPLRPVAIGGYEDEFDEDAGVYHRSARWSFAGNITFTSVALTSLEADRLFDQIVAVIAFGQLDPTRSQFRQQIENDDLMEVSVNFDQVDQRGFSSAPGTPWGTDSMMYERTISIQAVGEFVNKPGSYELLPISGYKIYEYINELESDPSPPPPDGWIS